jgi:cell wall-associated protease
LSSLFYFNDIERCNQTKKRIEINADGMKQKLFYILSFTILCSNSLFAQFNLQKWYQQDPQQDSVLGISLDKAYQFLQGKKFTPLIIAVIDSGIDTAQADLRNEVWTNTKEIPGNGIDDDGNGYVDDVHGWDFLGNKNGKELNTVPSEGTRVYYHFRSKYLGKNINEDSLSEEGRYEYETWRKSALQMDAAGEDQRELNLLNLTLKTLNKQDVILREAMGKNEYSVEELENFATTTPEAKKAKYTYLSCMKILEVKPDITNVALLADLNEESGDKKTDLDAKLKAPNDVRAEIVGDDYYNINDKNYGNNDVSGPGPMHGTHVSGIIAAQRGNNLCIDGIDDHVKIMMLRAVPGGDEYDKDIALAIRYAVDNGAKIINMSFGKYFSPEKKWVDDAVRYAASKDVLLVHAAGNESKDVDTIANYPNPDLIFLHGTANNFINVGASGDSHVSDGKVIAYFSNYGAQNVDVFAPGIKIYSTVPGDSACRFESGTSMSAPIVTGIAGLIREYYPQLTAAQVKYILIKSSLPVPDYLKTIDPGTEKPTNMKNLCKAGGIVNAYSALQLADTLSKQLLNKTASSKTVKKN